MRVIYYLTLEAADGAAFLEGEDDLPFAPTADMKFNLLPQAGCLRPYEVVWDVAGRFFEVAFESDHSEETLEEALAYWKDARMTEQGRKMYSAPRG